MEERARRVKSLLEGYYGAAKGAGEDDVQAQASAASARLDINAKGFDSDHYVSSLIRESKLEDLLQQHVSWAAEIKNLDSDMQMLVYENYSKFISATDTIRRMKDNVGGMESSMDRLLQTVTAVQAKSDAVNASLFERRERIEELNGTRSLLRKAQYIFDLPKRLRQFAKVQNYRAAVQAYQGALPILTEYGDTSFKSVKEEAEEVMGGVTRKLQEVVMSDYAPFDQRSQAATLLQALNQPVETLMDDYLALHWERLLRQLREAAEAASRASEASSTAEGAVQQSLVDALNRDFVEDFERTASHFRGIFPMGNDKLTASTRDLFNEYIGHVKKSMQRTDGGKTSAADLMFALRNLSRDVGKMAELVPGAMLSERAAEAMEAAVKEHVVQSFALLELRITDTLHSLARPSKAHGAPPPPGGSLGVAGGAGGAGSLPGVPADRLYVAWLESMEVEIVSGCINLLEDLRNLLDGRVELLLPSHNDIIFLVHSELSLLLTSLNTHFLNICSPATPSSSSSSLGSSNATSASLGSAAPPAIVLLLARMSQLLEQSELAKISAAIDTHFPFPSLRLDDDAAAGDAMAAAFVPAHFSALFHTTSERLLQQYVEMESKKLCQMVGKSVTTPNWIKYKEPKDVRMVVDLIIQEVESIREVARQLLGTVSETAYGGRSQLRGAVASSSKGGRAGTSSSGGGIGSSAGAGGARAAAQQQRARSRVLERDVAKLFKQKVEIFTRLEFSRSSVLSTLVKTLLKTYQECVRLQTFGRSGYQQIQLDALVLCDGLRGFVDDDAVVDSLMDEVCTAAAERSLDPTPMDAMVMDRIIQARREKRGL